MTTDDDERGDLEIMPPGRLIKFPGQPSVEPSTAPPSGEAADPDPDVVEAEFVDDGPTKAVLSVDQPHDVLDVLPWHQPDERRPIIHPAFTKEHWSTAWRWYLGRTFHRVKFHAVRVPFYQSKVVLRAPWGLVRVGSRVWDWLTVAETKTVKQMAVRHAETHLKEGYQMYTGAERVAAPKMRARRIVLIVSLLVLIGGGFALYYLTPLWVPVLLILCVIDILGYAGAAPDKPVIGPAVVSEQYVKLTSDIVVRGLSSTGIPALSSKDAVITFPAPIQRDGEGWRAEVDLPHGTTATEVIKARNKLASGLRRQLGCVWPESDPDVHEGRLVLWVGDKDLARKGYVRWPLANKGRHDFFSRLPFGEEPRGRLVTIPVFEHNILIGAIPGQGKALALDTPVPTPTGWTTMGELQNGDTVYDDQGQPCRVVTAWPVRYQRPCYEVQFSDGSVIVADADHLWEVETAASRRSAMMLAKPKNRTSKFSRDQRNPVSSAPKVLSTVEMADVVTTEHGLRLNYSVSVAKPLIGRRTSLSIDPYLLGCWLGDGDMRGGRITNADELFGILASDGHRLGAECIDSRNGVITRSVRGLTTALRESGLLGNKHIPETYLRAPESQRRALLAGLLDTDGYVDTQGGITFAVTNRRLALDFRHLVATLGYKSSLTSRPAMLNGKCCGTAWTVKFTPPDRVFRVKRKARRQTKVVRTTATRRYITAIRPVDSVPVRCITVDSPSSLYLVGDQCIPTHNTAAARCIICAEALDPTVELWIHELAGKGDYDPLEIVSHRFVSGIDDEAMAYAAASLKMLRAEAMRRVAVLKSLPRDICPDKKITREIADKRSLKLWPLVALFEEVQNLFSHPDYGKAAGADAEFVIRVGRAVGMVLILSTQRPDKDALPTGVSGNVSIKLCLYVPGQVENDMILGTSSYQNGLRATAPNLRPSIDAGIGILKGATPIPLIVKAAYLNMLATERVAKRARALREAAKTLSGVAVGEEQDSRFEATSLLDDLQVVYAQAERTDRAGVWSQELCAKLAELRPDVYGGWDPDTLASALKPYAVRTVQLHMPDETGARRTRYGLRRELLDHALAVRAERRKLEQ